MGACAHSGMHTYIHTRRHTHTYIYKYTCTHTHWEQHRERICVAVTVCSCDSTFISALTQIGPHGWHRACTCGRACTCVRWSICEVVQLQETLDFCGVRLICLRSRWIVEVQNGFTFVNAGLNFCACVFAACACASLKRRTTPQFHSSVHFDVEWFPYHDCFRSFDPRHILVHCSFEWDLYSGDREHTHCKHTHTDTLYVHILYIHTQSHVHTADGKCDCVSRPVPEK